MQINSLKIPALLVFGFLLIQGCNELPEGLVSADTPGSFTYLNSGLTNKNVWVVFEDRSGNIWAGTDNGVGRLDGEKFTLFDAGDGLITGGVRAIMQSTDGNLWFGGPGGISIYDGLNFDNNEGLIVNSLLQDSDGNIWIGMYDGLYRIQPNSQVFYYNDPNCPECNYMDEIREDSEGNVWFATYQGVLQFDGAGFNWFTEADGLEDTYVQAIAEDHRGRVWFGHYLTERISIYNNGTFTTETNPAATNDLVSLAAKGKNMYIATWGGGLLLYDGVVVQPVKLPKSDEIINHVSVDSKGTVWIGTSENGVIRHIPSL